MRRLSKCKGQFFIISSIILVSILLSITQYFSEYGVDLTKIEENIEFDYIANIKDVLYKTAETAPCNRMDTELKYSEKIIEEELAKNGIKVSIIHNIVSCSNIHFTFTIESSNFFSKTEFNYP